MKLLFCVRCNSVFNLKVGEIKTCQCGQCGGKYQDEVNAEYWGDPRETFVIGFANSTLASAIREQRDLGDSSDTMYYAGRQVAKGRDFTAFVVPESAPSIRRLVDRPKDA